MMDQLMKQSSVEESLKELIDAMPLDLPLAEGYPAAIIDNCELRFGFRRGWHQCETKQDTQLKPLRDAYSAWLRNPLRISEVVTQLHALFFRSGVDDAA